jgi:hypothetical protein
LHASVFVVLGFLGLGVIVILAESSLGISIGSRFPDFSDGPRPRFVTVVGSIIGAVLGIVEMAIMALPLVLSFILRTFLAIQIPLQFVLVFSGAVGGLLTWVAYVLSIKPVHSILSELPNWIEEDLDEIVGGFCWPRIIVTVILNYVLQITLIWLATKVSPSFVQKKRGERYIVSPRGPNPTGLGLPSKKKG